MLCVSCNLVPNNQPIAASVVTPLYRHLNASRPYLRSITEVGRQSIGKLLWRLVYPLFYEFDRLKCGNVRS